MPIKITEILIQGEKGQRGLNYRQEDYVETNPVVAVIDLIRIIAESADKHHIKQEGDADITRAISDEFTFYPKAAPFTIDEYKKIIRHTAEIASTLAPDVHLVLATFPVLWPDGGVHNCGLYVQSPLKSGTNAIIHHFSKQYILSCGDLSYFPLLLKTDAHCNEQQLPPAILGDTAVSVNDVNQYASALKVTTSSGGELIISLAVCLDHFYGVERKHIHGLIEKLRRNQKSIPLYCSQVIVSNTQAQLGAHIVSTLSHADSNPLFRSGMQVINTQLQSSHMIRSLFSGALSIEIYFPAFIGILHSDLFQHAIACQPTFNINQKNLLGDTLLHHVFLEALFNYELIAKRLYTLVVHGADPCSLNNNGLSTWDMAKAIVCLKDQEVVTKAIRSALEWRDSYFTLNQVSLKYCRRSMLTSAFMQGIEKKNFDKVYSLVVNGANPFLKDGFNRSAMDILDSSKKVEHKHEIYERILEIFLKTQYGFAVEESLYGEPIFTHSGQKNEVNNKRELWFSSRQIKQMDSFKEQLLEASKLVDIGEKNKKYLCMFKEIEKTNFSLKEIFPEIVSFIVENINSGEGLSSRELRAWILLRLIECPFEIISTVRELILIKSALSQDEFLSLYVAVIELLPKILTSANEVMEALTLFPPEYRSDIFLKIKPCLPSLLETQVEINSFFSYLLTEEVALLLDDVKERILKALTGQYQVWLFTSMLSNESFIVTFNKIAPHVLTLMQKGNNVYLVKLLKKFSEAHEEIKDSLGSLVSHFSAEELASLKLAQEILSISTCMSAGFWVSGRVDSIKGRSSFQPWEGIGVEKLT